MRGWEDLHGRPRLGRDLKDSIQRNRTRATMKGHKCYTPPHVPRPRPTDIDELVPRLVPIGWLSPAAFLPQRHQPDTRQDYQHCQHPD
jgi:hypothetical protein